MYWNDDKKGLKIGSEFFGYGDKVPTEKLDKKRVKQFEADGCLISENPNPAPPNKKKAKKGGN